MDAERPVGGVHVPVPGVATSFYHRARHGFPARYPLVQFPNTPLIVALAAWLIAGMTEGLAHDIAQDASYAAFVVWAFLEVKDPANLFRRLLGASALVYFLLKWVELI